jgi:hypothetical protein
MDWANEQYILVYVRDTGDWLMWGWETRALLLFLFRKVDRAGILHLGKGKLRALSKIVEMPEDVVVDAIAPLLEDGCVQIHGDKLVIPNFLLAQEAKHSDKVRKQMSRERERARLLSQPVTRGHTESHEVTLPYPTQSNPRESDSDARATEVIPEEEPEEQTGVRHISSRPPPPAPQAGTAEDFEAYLRSKPKLSDLDVQDLAALASQLHDPGNVPLGMLREAIDDANDKSERAEQRHLRHGRVVGFMKRAKTAPRKPDPKPPAQRESDDRESVARIRKMPRRVTFDDPRAAALVAKLGVGPSGAQAPPGPRSEAELADKARLDKQRLLEAEKKAGGT